MKRILISCVTLAAFAAPALAAEPDGSFVWKDPTHVSPSNGSAVGQASSTISQNGQFVSGNCLPACDADLPYVEQTTTPGSRADAVLGLLGKTRGK